MWFKRRFLIVLTLLLHVCASALCLCVITLTCHAEIMGDEVQAQLLPVEKSSPNSLSLKIQFKIKSGWHVYGLNPGEMGRPPTIRFKLSEGLLAQTPQWPADHEFEMGEYHCAGYSDDFIVTTLVNIIDAEKFKNEGLGTVLVSWLSCDGVTCVAKKAQLEVPKASS